jgi:hypothetical protein
MSSSFAVFNRVGSSGRYVAAAFTESVYYPYTSLKYHTLLVAALLDTYRAGHEFSDLQLVVDDADEIVSQRTVYADEEFALRIDADTRGQPPARLGSRPWRSWASVWNRIETHPLDTDGDKYDMVLDANRRRIGAWSTEAVARSPLPQGASGVSE